ncbi:delta(14)-sterol reductase-like [Dendronephthya gigantea]|uniref:delta(14)-sterol reductase-like n=1 Tax=Dendronephthya gigantea TaxID=151771 RepID=UPI00106AE4B7|nr:delta(14)-sterol reductase-like [Dendronephthya gigantea]
MTRSQKSDKGVKKVIFQVGEEIMARWPGSQLWYEAVVLSVNYEEDIFLLRYPDGQENEVPYSHLSAKGRFRHRSASPSRQRKSSPGRRRRSRSKSPSRKKPTSPKATSPRRRGRPQRVSSEASAVAKDLDEKPATEEGTVTVTTKTKVSKTPPRTAVGQQLEARVTRSALKQLEKQGIDTEGIRKGLGEGLDERKPSKGQSYAFGGPICVLFMMITMPMIVYATYFYCNKKKCYHLSEIFKNPKITLPSAKAFFDPQAAAVVYGWIAFQAFLNLLPLGKVVEGLPLQDRTKLKYRLNGFSALIISLVLFAACLHFKIPVAKFIHGKFLALITHSLIFSFILSVLLYIKSYVEKTGLSKFGSTGNVIYDFFMGRQTNPRIGSFDIKFFFEMRPGIIGLVIIDLAMFVDVYQKSGNEINVALLLVCLFHFLYIVDGLWFEGALLSSAEISLEGFGFMLAFGDLVWVPFTFSLHSRFLAEHTYKIPVWLALFVFALNTAGFIVYRVSNLQKDLFRQNPNHPAVQHLESMATLVPGSRLLISGWWGYVRHPNYLGDILMGIAWSMTCGFSYAIPYFYPVYLISLLVYRSYRFEAHCRQKYGLTWEEYCKRVPYRIFPNLF